MPAPTPQITDAELAVLELMWERGPMTAREITDALYPAGRVSDKATVQKLLERLEAKECVDRDRSAFVHVIRPRISRAQILERQLRTVAEKLSGGSMVPLLMHLVEETRLSAAERRKLREMLDAAHPRKDPS